jgi:hypothetical protein
VDRVLTGLNAGVEIFVVEFDGEAEDLGIEPNRRSHIGSAYLWSDLSYLHVISESKSSHRRRMSFEFI